VEKARAKGVKDSLIVMGDLALIVNVPSKTVVTAVDGENLKENIFTNIDGAVIL
jgi:flagellar operon protein